MKFTINSYKNLLTLLREKEYQFINYGSQDKSEKTVILRHDVDFTMEKALEMAAVEYELGVKSTYFVLLTTNFYNLFSKQTYEKLIEIKRLGHEIGLHFDEKRYEIQTIDEMKQLIAYECEVLSNLLGEKISVISMHRPSKLVLENNIEFDQLINSYSTKYFKDMKYLSDSRMHWRENPLDAIKSGQFNKLHILTHPFWYTKTHQSMEEKLRNFLSKAIQDRYAYMFDNFTALDEVIRKESVVLEDVGRD